MLFEAGILFAFGALVFWGFGDFLIQKTARKLGDWEPLLIITGFGVIVLTPFVYNDISNLIFASDYSFLLLLGSSLLILFAALFDFEALRKGKLAIIEPILAFEVPVSVLLAFTLLNESLPIIQTIFISLLLVGIIMVSLKSKHLSRKVWLERGALLAIVGAILMGSTNFIVGVASRETSFLMVNWFMNIVLTLLCAFYILVNRRTKKFILHIKQNKKLLLGMSIFDNTAWICYAAAATLIPIAIAVSISEGYIALAALLGVMINKERLMRHQKFGLLLALFGAIALAITYA